MASRQRPLRPGSALADALAAPQLEAADDKGRKSAQRAVDTAASRLNNFGRELDSLRAMPPPRIEAGPGAAAWLSEMSRPVRQGMPGRLAAWRRSSPA